jgi:hypothetical protein
MSPWAGHSAEIAILYSPQQDSYEIGDKTLKPSPRESEIFNILKFALMLLDFKLSIQ